MEHQEREYSIFAIVYNYQKYRRDIGNRRVQTSCEHCFHIPGAKSLTKSHLVPFK